MEEICIKDTKFIFFFCNNFFQKVSQYLVVSNQREKNLKTKKKNKRKQKITPNLHKSYVKTIDKLNKNLVNKFNIVFLNA